MRAVIALILLLLAACDTESAGEGQAQPESNRQALNPKGSQTVIEGANGMRATLSYRFAGRAAPTASFAGADGRRVTLGNFAGRPLLVNLWATWCAPCKAEMPTLDALAALEQGRLAVIAVSQDIEGHKPVAAFFKKSSIRNLEPFTDPENALSGAFDSRIVLPTTILYDSKGREVWRVVGGAEWDDSAMIKLLRQAE